jgi:hypothetical protein
MASPFSIFRKNQKAMLAVVTILAMFAFVFLPIFMEQMGSSKVQNPVAVKTTKYGDLHERDVRNLVEEHHRVLAILTEVLQMAGAPPSLAGRILESSLGAANMENVVNSWLLSRYAEQMGMVISDQTVNSWLKMITQDSVTAANFQAAFKHHGLSEFQFFKLMRDELAALQLKNMFETSLMALTPAQRWEYFCRVKQTATIEAVGVPVANYLRRIDEPGDEELKAFFEQYKDRYALPDSPEPGFREPQRIALQYFKVNLDKFASGVSDEEVKAHYEKNRQLYDQPEKKPESKKAEEPSAKDTKDVKPADKGDAKKASQPSAAKPPETGKQPATAKPEAAKQPAKAPQLDKDKKPKGTSAIERSSPFVLTALLKDEKPADQAKSPAQKPAEKAAAPKKEPAPATTPAPAKPEAKPSSPPPTKAAPASAAPTQPAPVAQPKPLEAKPGLAEATKKRIRQELAWERITKVFEGLREKMDDYRRERSGYDVAMIQRQNKKDGAVANKALPPLPPSLDFEKLAKQNGLTAGQTKLISQWEAQGLEIGASFVSGREPVARYAFLTLAKFHPAESMNLGGERYLFWKTEETKDRVPEYTGKGVREQVLQAWKMIRARSLAVKDADALAAAARKAKKPLKQALADRPDIRVVMPPAFSWITFGNVPLGSAPNAARISSVAGVNFAGEEFMRTVFHLEPSQIGVAMNAPKTMAYVIRLNELSPSQEVLWKQFEVDDFSKYAPAAATDQRQVVHAWLDEIKTSAGLEWKHKPDQVQQESGPREEED